MLPVLGVFGVDNKPNCASMPVKMNDYEDDSSSPPHVVMNTTSVRKRNALKESMLHMYECNAWPLFR